MTTIIFTLFVVTLLYNSGAALPNYQASRKCVTEDGFAGNCVSQDNCSSGSSSSSSSSSSSEYGAGVFDPRISEDDNNCPTSTVCCKVAGNNELNIPATASPSETHNVKSPTPTKNKNPSSDQSSSRLNSNTKSPANTKYQNQLEKPTAGLDQPQTKPLTCKTRDGSSGECVQNYLCDRNTNYEVTDGEGIIDPRMEEDSGCPIPMICCKVAADNDQNNTTSRKTDKNYSDNVIAGDNNVKDPANPNVNQNQGITPIANVVEAQPITCRTKDGSSGECVQSYLCDRNTNMEVTDGEGIIDPRMEEDNGCPIPMVCCKVAADNKNNNTASRENNNNNGNNVNNVVNPNVNQNQGRTPIANVVEAQPITCRTKDGSSGECVQNYLCDRNTNMEVTDGEGIIDPRMEEDGCPIPMVCCKIATDNNDNDTDRRENNKNDRNNVKNPANPNINQNQAKTPFANEVEAPSQHYLCDRETNAVLTNSETGEGMIDPRMDGSKCPIPMEVHDNNGHIDFATPAKDYNTVDFITQEVEMPLGNLASDDRFNPYEHSRNNLNRPLSRPHIYPYIRVARDLNRPGCGWRNPDGVNVSDSGAPLFVAPNQAKPGEFPWTVSVMNFTRRVGNIVRFEYLGNGALIHERAVLTAAHIFDGRDLKADPLPLYVTVGDYDQTGGRYLPRKAVKVDKVVIHENYNENLAFNDLALVFLHKPVLPSGHVNYICLPPPNHVDPAGSTCVTSGWGKDGHGVHQYQMSTADLPVVDQTTCQNLYRTHPKLGPGFILDQSFMCAGHAGVDSCKGSGGAPLACPMENTPDRYILSGLMSWSPDCSLDGRPSAFAKVTSARQWIDDKMAAHSYKIKN